MDISSLGDHFGRLRCTVDIFSQILFVKTVDVGKQSEPCHLTAT